MKVLVVGNGGREHAIAWRLVQDASIQVICVPGNGGTATLPRCQNLGLTQDDFEGIARFCTVNNVALVVVGPEIPLAAGITENHTGFDKGWTMSEDRNSGEIQITSERMSEVPGTHFVAWNSETDTLEIIHTAKSRQGFALGAVIAAEWVIGRTGFFGMKDLLKTDN